MISRISGLMYAEHAIILEGLILARSLNKTWEKDPKDYEHKLTSLLTFFKEYADQYHHYKEEEILFPALMKTQEPSVVAVVGELLEHHEEFRELVRNIKSDLALNNYAGAQQKLDAYCHDLMDHIAAENEELFPMADNLLDEDELDRIYYKAIDKDVELGTARKEELENFIKNFNYTDEPVR